MSVFLFPFLCCTSIGRDEGRTRLMLRASIRRSGRECASGKTSSWRTRGWGLRGRHAFAEQHTRHASRRSANETQLKRSHKWKSGEGGMNNSKTNGHKERAQHPPARRVFRQCLRRPHACLSPPLSPPPYQLRTATCIEPRLLFKLVSRCMLRGQHVWRAAPAATRAIYKKC